MRYKSEKTQKMMTNGKRQYLVTYSQLDKLFPARQSFGEIIAKEFNRGESAVYIAYYLAYRKYF